MKDKVRNEDAKGILLDKITLDRHFEHYDGDLVKSKEVEVDHKENG